MGLFDFVKEAGEKLFGRGEAQAAAKEATADPSNNAKVQAANAAAADAMFVSLNHGLPTLNGYSAWAPEGWNLMNPPEPEYEKRAREWASDHRLAGVCALDIDARTMRPAFSR